MSAGICRAGTPAARIGRQGRTRRRQEIPMSLEERIPEMSEKELENLQANAERIAKGAVSKQQAEAERLLPIIAEAMVTRKAARSVEMAEKKVTRQKEMAATRARKAASKKAEADAAAEVD